MNRLKNTIQDISRWLSGKEPYRIFYKSTFHYKSYDEPMIGAGIFGSTEYGYDWTDYDYTWLGKFMNKLPIIPEILIKGVYYVITWPLYLCVMIPWWLFRVIFIPSGWL